MNLYNIKKSSINETNGVSLNLYLSGCHGYCPGCHSDHTWDFNSGEELIISSLVNYINDIPSFQFDNICVLGGEPLDQPEEEIVELLKALKTNFPTKSLWLYTHFEEFEVSQEVKDNLDYLKTGMYLKDLPEAKVQYGVYLASNNQVIHKLKK